jgi:hypothetical protein
MEKNRENREKDRENGKIYIICPSDFSAGILFLI